MNALGWREWAALPEIGVPAVRAKIDTGARTSAIHARSIEPFDRDGERRVRFTLCQDRRRAWEIVCEAGVTDVRVVKDSGGHVEERFVIETPLRIGDRPDIWPIEVTLANRADMLFTMLVGRTAISRRFVVDPARSFVAGKPTGSAPMGSAP